MDETNKRIAMTAIRFERIQAEYAKTEKTYIEPSYFTGGYAKAIAQINGNEQL